MKHILGMSVLKCFKILNYYYFFCGILDGEHDN